MEAILYWLKFLMAIPPDQSQIGFRDQALFESRRLFTICSLLFGEWNHKLSEILIVSIIKRALVDAW